MNSKKEKWYDKQIKPRRSLIYSIIGSFLLVNLFVLPITFHNVLYDYLTLGIVCLCELISVISIIAEKRDGKNISVLSCIFVLVTLCLLSIILVPKIIYNIKCAGSP